MGHIGQLRGQTAPNKTERFGIIGGMTRHRYQNSNWGLLIESTPIQLPPKMTLKALAAILGCHPVTVRRRMQKYSINKCADGLIRAKDARRLIEE
tara:strand:- start:3999 stop:4283 length:285 start_codon:yes stop_codon:yes gene_type:complete